MGARPYSQLVELLIPCPSPPRLFYPHRVAHTHVYTERYTNYILYYLIAYTGRVPIIAGGRIDTPLDGRAV